MGNLTIVPMKGRFLTPDEAVSFLGLRSRAALAYLLRGEDPPPFVYMGSRRKVFDPDDLTAWIERRKAAKLAAEPHAHAKTEREKLANMPLDPRTPKVRMFPPVDGPFRAVSREGRAYIADGTKPMNVPVADVGYLARLGWTICFTLGSTSDDRPARPKRGERHLEGINLMIFDGRQWRDVSTGAVV